MLNKPKSCIGCPLYGDGKGFVPDLCNEQAAVFVLGQNPGVEEEQGRRVVGYEGTHPIYERCIPQPFIGVTGYDMDRNYLPRAGLSRDQVSLGNVLRCRWKHVNEMPKLNSVIFKKALDHCHTAHFKLPSKTRLIIAQGEFALYAMTQEGFEKDRKLLDWRGYVLPFTPVGTPRVTETGIWSPLSSHIVVLCTYHIAYTYRNATAKLITRWDWCKVAKILAGTWPAKLPTVKEGPPQLWPKVSAFDTEYVPYARKFLCYSLYDGKTLRVSDKLDSGIISPETMHTVIMHNAAADLGFLDVMLPKSQYRFEDTMLAHAVLWSDFAHDLGFLGSIYGSLNRWKHLDQLNPHLYSAADAYATWEAWGVLEKALDRESCLRAPYERNKSVVPIIMRSEERGIQINHVRAKQAYTDRLGKIQNLGLKAQAIAGWPINPASNPQTSQQLFEVDGLLRLLKVE